MKEEKANRQLVEDEQVVDVSRRKAIKKITIGVGVMAGIAMLPESWTKPIIGEVVLPAHAQTSGSNHCTVNSMLGTWYIRGNAATNYFENNINLLSGGSISGDAGTDGSWSLSNGHLIIIVNFVDGSITGTNTINGVLGAGCNSLTGTIITTASNGGYASDTIRTGTKVS